MMLEGGKISYKQIIPLIIITIISTAILYLPTILYNEAKQDGWLSIILSIIVGIIIAYIIINLSLMFKDKTIIQYSELIVGKVLGKVISLIFCLFFIHINSIIIREFAELLSGPFLPETPTLFFIIVIVMLSLYAVSKGLEVIVRINQIIFPIFLFATIFILLLSLKEMELSKLLPIIADGVKPVLMGTYKHLIWYSETLIIAMLIPYINIPYKVRRQAVISIIVTGLVELFVFVSIVVSYGKATISLTFPFLTFARYVSVGNFIERLDSFIISMWIMGVFIKITIFYYCAVLSLTQWLKYKDYRYLTIPIGVILIVLSMIQWNNMAELRNQLSSTLIIPYSVVQIVIPFILFIIAKLRRRWGVL